MTLAGFTQAGYTLRLTCTYTYGIEHVKLKKKALVVTNVLYCVKVLN